MLVIKAFCLEQGSAERIEGLQNQRLHWISRRSKMGAAASSTLSMGYWSGYFFAFGWGSFGLSKGTTTFGTLTAFLQLVGQVQGPMVGLANTLPQMIALVGSAGRLREFESLQMENNSRAVPGWDSVGIYLDNISFSYENKPVFKNLSIRIAPGEIVALVGPSGEGKTTFVRLLLSLLNITEGHIYFTNDKGEKMEVSAASRAFLSYVPQGNTLFSGTIADNLRVGCSDASDSELEAVSRSACAWEFIEKLPEGLNTVIGEKGHGLSEGQAQRLAIARALLHKAPVLVLDEATSALDAKTELKVLQTIQRQNPGRTCIAITHRMTVLKICSRVLKLEDGRIVEQNKRKIAEPVDEAV
jgi:ABC-type multidrug transport system fused ATPase/permease subunit